MLFIRDDVKTNSKNSKNRTLLSYAAKNKHENIIKMLFDRNDVSIKLKDRNERISLFHAANKEHKNIVKILLNRDDVDADYFDDWNKSKLWYAVFYDRTSIIQLFVERENVKLGEQAEDESTPLSLTIQMSNEDIVRMIEEKMTRRRMNEEVSEEQRKSEAL